MFLAKVWVNKLNSDIHTLSMLALKSTIPSSQGRYMNCQHFADCTLWVQVTIEVLSPRTGTLTPICFTSSAAASLASRAVGCRDGCKCRQMHFSMSELWHTADDPSRSRGSSAH